MRTKKIGSEIIHLQTVDSTNEYINRLLDKGEKVLEGTVVWADFQTGGKGHMGNTWDSEAGKNLLISILLRSEFLKVHEQFYISESISLSLFDLLSNYSAEVEIKWPNDILIKKRKVAGILIENTIEKDKITQSVAGMGININQKRFGKELPDPTSLSLETGQDYQLRDILDELLSCMNERYKQLFFGKFEQIRTEYLSKLFRYGLESRFFHKSEYFTGIITGVNPSGEILIEDTSKKIRKYAFKEVDFVLT